MRQTMPNIMHRLTTFGALMDKAQALSRDESNQRPHTTVWPLGGCKVLATRAEKAAVCRGRGCVAARVGMSGKWTNQAEQTDHWYTEPVGSRIEVTLVSFLRRQPI